MTAPDDDVAAVPEPAGQGKKQAITHRTLSARRVSALHCRVSDAAFVAALSRQKGENNMRSPSEIKRAVAHMKGALLGAKSTGDDEAYQNIAAIFWVLRWVEGDETGQFSQMLSELDAIDKERNNASLN
jgi:hypothetical protein